jgi:hypothetical protein
MMRLALGGSDAFASFWSLAPSGMKVAGIARFFPGSKRGRAGARLVAFAGK